VFRRPKGIEITIGGFFLIIALVVYTLINSNKPTPFEKCKDDLVSTATRKVESSSIPVEAIWGLSGLKIENVSPDKNLLMYSTPSFIVTASMGCNSVMALTWDAGKNVWRTEIIDPSNLTLDGARNRVYVSGREHITALSITDGKRLWQNASDNFVRNAHRVLVRGDGQVTVKANGDWFIDSTDGKLYENPVELGDSETDYRPTIDTHVLDIVDSISSYTVISNAVQANKLIYVLDADAQLHIIDREAGAEVGYIQFQRPEKKQLLYSPGAIGGSWLAVDNNRVAIYFQDTDTLSVYQMELPE
jgi:hypothetical protein